MNWGSASEFFAMGGYAFFVWGSYGVALVALVVEPCLAARRHRLALAALAEAADAERSEAADAAVAEAADAAASKAAGATLESTS